MRPTFTAPLAVLTGLLLLASPARSQTELTAGAVAEETARTRAVLEAYWQDHDPRYVAEDAVFTLMPSGQEISGRDAIAAHLHHFYREALDARAERTGAIFGPGAGLLEAVVVGTHTGEFAGVAATGRAVRVPIAVAYELENGLITRARIYIMMNVLMAQISAPAGP